jgi:hypothetical protein
MRIFRHVLSTILRVCSACTLALFAAATQASAPSDPPGFAPVTLKGSQVIFLNVSCFDHPVGDLLPNRCRGETMFHDAAGRVLKVDSYDLRPGESTSLRLAVPATNAAGRSIGRVLIIPCVIPSEGRAIPSVEVFDRDAGRVVLFENPASERMSDFSDGSTNGRDVAFDPQPDPPVFGMATLRANEEMRMNVTCFDHDVNGSAPNSCAGTVMFHDVAGNVIRRGSYALDAGQTRSFEVAPPALRMGTLVGIIPCVLPEPGGRVVPNIEVTDAAANVVLLINPAAARASQFQLPDVATPR